MKRFLLIISVACTLNLSVMSASAQESGAVDASAATELTVDRDVADFQDETDVHGEPLHQVIKQKFLEGGAAWMAPILLCLVFGLAIVIERVLYLNLATVNTRKLMAAIEQALDEGGIEAAKEICRNTRGPVASIFYQGLDRYDQGLDAVEKSVVSYGSVQMGQMESGMSWISLFIALAPMLGFLGTVVGMVQAFDAIEGAQDISPTLVAGGIKVALLTTLAGLIVAIVLQLFYNYILSKIDALVIQMEDSSISLVDMLAKYGRK